MSARSTPPLLALALLATGCLGQERAPSRPVEGVEAAMARTRAQFESARHGGGGHSARGCPLCADPLAGQLPPEVLLDGPAEVWN